MLHHESLCVQCAQAHVIRDVYASREDSWGKKYVFTYMKYMHALLHQT